jgi:hypothetical protein
MPAKAAKACPKSPSEAKEAKMMPFKKGGKAKKACK